MWTYDDAGNILSRNEYAYATGTLGIQQNRIRSIILPLLADHVLREANNYFRLLESGVLKSDETAASGSKSGSGGVLICVR